MSGILHKAEDALHLNHHSHNKPESAKHEKGPEQHDFPTGTRDTNVFYILLRIE